jgi:hypothetical protein
MQITAELDAQHLEKLYELLLRKNQSELIALAIIGIGCAVAFSKSYTTR